jgi:hypothetical protein
MEAINDGGPAFPVKDAATWQAHGMSQRAVFSALLMHAELLSCGGPGEACDALVAAAAASGREVEDQMATNAVQCADALLRALQVEPEPRYRDLSAAEEDELRIGRAARAALESAKADPAFALLTPEVQERVRGVVLEFLEAEEIPF